MFRSATLRLTLLSVAVTMTISIIFSGVVYHIATGEINGSARRQYVGLRRQYHLSPPLMPPVVTSEEDEAAHQLLLRLVDLNLLILGASALAGYYWARRTLEPIETAMDMQGRFAADASHELRTPLAAMRSELEVALRQPQITETESRALIKSSLEEIDKLEGLANGLLQLARLESGHTQVQFGPVDLAAVITSAIAALSGAAKHKKITLTQTGVTNDILIPGEATGLSQVVQILLDNAIKYSPPKSTVTIKTARRAHKLHVSIIDTGPGIAAADQAHIFERFWRAGSARHKSATGGYGLGLAIAQEIVAHHNGDIHVTSKLGHGSTFTVELPLIH